jgi:hypothetical protein
LSQTDHADHQQERKCFPFHDETSEAWPACYG